MKKIEAIIKPFKLDEVKEALAKAGIEGMPSNSATHVQSQGGAVAMVNMRKGTWLGLLLLSLVAPAAVRVAWGEDAPTLPAYFTATNADAEKPTWPDPTGAASGVWATPAG